MIPLKEFQKRIERSQEFKEYKEENQDAILADVFTMLKEWQLDYYSTSSDKITSFIIENGEIIKRESELFRKKREEILPLNLDNIKFPIEKALEKTKIKNAQQTIVALQVINKKPTWNITYLTTTFNTINIKVDVISGEILSKEESFLLKNIKLGDLIKKNPK